MALKAPITLHLPTLHRPLRGSLLSRSSVRSSPLISSLRFCRLPIRCHDTVIKASSAAGNPYYNSDSNPYEILDITPITSFDKMKMAYTKKRKEAERSGDREYMAILDRAYDKIMMSQLQNRKKGVTFGSFKISEEIKKADERPFISWFPRRSLSSERDMHINMAISAAFTAWIVITRTAQWKPMQFLAFAYFYRIFDKLKAFESPLSGSLNEYGEEEGRGMRMGKRMLRSLGLVFFCIGVASAGYPVVLWVFEMLGGFVPSFIYNKQEVIITTASSILLYIMASFFR